MKTDTGRSGSFRIELGTVQANFSACCLQPPCLPPTTNHQSKPSLRQEVKKMEDQDHIWRVGRVILAKDKGIVPIVHQPRGFVGAGKDQVQCIYCSTIFQALADRLRNHVAGGGVGSEAAHIKACVGVLPVDGESADVLEARKKSFPEARAKFLRINAEKARKKDDNDMIVDLNLVTGGAPSDADGGGGLKRARPLQQSTLDRNTDADLRQVQLGLSQQGR